MTGHGEKSRQKDLFLAALMTLPTVEKAAAQVGISQSTATRWLADPAFKQRYAEARRAALGEALAYLQQSMLAAVETLRTVMLAEDTRAQTKIMAARSILELGLKSFELEDLETQMAEVLHQMETLRGTHHSTVSAH